MRSPSKPQTETVPYRHLEILNSLGFGPDTVLMNDPKLFVDRRFLASILVELHDKLGQQKASLALFEIGLLHGLRDAARVCRERDDLVSDAAASPTTTSVVIQWTGGVHMDEAGALSLEGVWTEQHEAVARVSKLGAPESPSCWMSAGYTTGWLSGTLNKHLIAREVSCAARGDKACHFEVHESSVWEASGDEEMQSLNREVPFETFRQIAKTSLTVPNDGPPNTSTQFDRSQPAVHIWGPVMVLPFTTLDEALGTVEMLGRDPSISEIRAVVIDLRERPLDAGLGAAALEQILETIELWNAQSLITGVSPESEAVMKSIEASHLILRKDLTQSIATAFQIADAQKHLI